jgi:hypothetical protein
MATVVFMIPRVIPIYVTYMVERHLRVTLTDEDIQRAQAYGEAEGLRMPRAYAELIRAGLETTDS